jgi:hypothetical protein
MGLATADLNNDGILDLVVATGAVLLGNGDGTFHAGTPIPVTNGRHVAIADFNIDGKPDVALDNSQPSVRIRLGDGAGGFGGGPTINVPGGLYDAFDILDVDANGSVDLAIGGNPVIAMNTLTPCPAINIMPASVPDGATSTFYGVVFSQSGGAGTASFQESGAVPGLTFSGSTLSGTPSQTGSFPFTITATDANGCTGMASYTLNVLLPPGSAPAGLVATATSPTTVALSWIGVLGTSHYEVRRSSSNNLNQQLIASPVNVGTSDPTIAPNTTYVYRVRAVNGGNTSSADSLPDIATWWVYTDIINVGGIIKAVHLTELRATANTARAAAGLAAYPFTDPSPGGIFIQALHIQQLRTALDLARTQIGVPALVYANTLTPGTTTVRAVDFTEIREGVK